MPVITPEERELRRAEEALFEKRYEEEKVAVAALRAKFQARWAEEDSNATSEDRVKVLAAALAWEEEQREARRRGSPTRGPASPEPVDAAGDRDREAPWEHSEHDGDGGLESSDGDISDHL